MTDEEVLAAIREAVAQVEPDRPELPASGRLFRLAAGLSTLRHPWADEAARVIGALATAMET